LNFLQRLIMKSNINLNLVTLALLFFAFVACKDSSIGEEKEEKPIGEELKLEPLDFKGLKIPLSPAAKEAVEDWELYQAMESEIERMNDFRLEDLIANSSTIYNAADTLQKTLPQKLRNRPVRARLKVLRSKTAQLKQLSERRQPDFKEMKKVADEIPLDFYNLNIQLNELFLDLPPIND